MLVDILCKNESDQGTNHLGKNVISYPKHVSHSLEISHVQVNEDLRAQLLDLQKKFASLTPSSSSTETPPGRKRPAPSPVSTCKTAAGANHEEETDEASPEPAAGEVSEAAKNNRLRRMCEKKPSGRCHVPSEIHERWAQGGAERLKLRDELEAANWNKDWPMVVKHCMLVCFFWFGI